MDKTPLDILLGAYREGKFPMADNREAEEVYLYDPPMRGQLSITDLHIPAKLKKTVLQFPYEVRINTAFEDVIDGCAERSKGRETTWINDTIRNLFISLHHAGRPDGTAHSVECWKGNKLVGGLYGLSIGGVFCGESMFSRSTDTSKISLVHLCARLWKGGFEVLDTQFINDHLKQFGVYEIPREEYLEKLQNVLTKKTDFTLSNINEKNLVQDYLKNRAS